MRRAALVALLCAVAACDDAPAEAAVTAEQAAEDEAQRAAEAAVERTLRPPGSVEAGPIVAGEGVGEPPEETPPIALLPGTQILGQRPGAGANASPDRIAEIADYADGRLMRVEGTVAQVDPAGRWLTLETASGAPFRVEAQDFTFPPSLAGTDAVVEGTLRLDGAPPMRTLVLAARGARVAG